MRSFQIKPDGIKRDLFVCKNKKMDNYTLFELMISKKLISENNSQVGKTINKHRRNSEEILKKTPSNRIKINFKSDKSPVTIIDMAIERKLRSMINKRFPDHGIFGE